MIVGNYVKTFAEASHALPDGMHMNADYPFMIPPITKIEGDQVTIKGTAGATVTFKIEKRKDGREQGRIYQASSFERLFNRKPSEFIVQPFKDEKTEAVEAKSL